MRRSPSPIHDAEKAEQTLSFHQHLYELARRRPLEKYGTHYPCRQRDLDKIWKHRHDNSQAQYITPAEASAELCDWLDDRKEPDALERLQAGIGLDPWGPDLIVKAFKDLDRAFFKGTLMGNVRVIWKCREDWDEFSHRWGRTAEDDAFGITSMYRHAQCTIVLNARRLLHNWEVQNVFRQMWRTLLHEMCHAYLLVKCGYASDDPGPYDDPTWSKGHTSYFRRCITAVDRRVSSDLGLFAISSDEDYADDC